MSMTGQLWALAKKDLLIAKRSKCRTCCELSIPLFIFPIIILLLVFAVSSNLTIQHTHINLEQKQGWRVF